MSNATINSNNSNTNDLLKSLPLIEIHLLQNHAPSNLNRDDTGSPKECVFGGVRRARISSQCLKRTIRRSDVFQEAMAGHLGTRTRRLPEIVRQRLKEAGVAADLAEVAAKKATGFGTNEGKERPANAKTGELETAQTMFLTEADITAVVATLQAAATEAGKANAFEKVAAKELQAKARQQGFRPISVDVALFGRMITSEAFRDVEGSCQVAHALSTHRVEHEFDYFTAVDDMLKLSEAEEDAGADMIGDVEYNSACYYKYFSLDVRGLVENLTGLNIRGVVPTEEDLNAAVALASRAVEAFLRASILVTPSGKQNTFAAHQLPELALVEVRPKRTPVSYANAFADAVRPYAKGEGDLVHASLERLKFEAEALTAGFNLEATTRLFLAPRHPGYDISGATRAASLNDLCGGIAAAAQGAFPNTTSTEVGNG